MAHTAELVVNPKAIVGEGPIWLPDEQQLYWLDITGNKLFIYNPATNENKTIDLPQMAGTVVPRASGGLMLAVENGFASYDPETRNLEILVDPEADGPEGNRFNDGKCDPAGRFWAGTMPFAEMKPIGALYRLDIDHNVKRMVGDVTVSNGIVWTLDESTMYYIDSPTCRIDAFDYDNDTGDVSNRRCVVNVPGEQGVPDGMTIDVNDNLWVAQFGGGGVNCWDPRTGKCIDSIEIPGAKQVTAGWFGGPDLEDLYITTAGHGLDGDGFKEQPNAGGLFVVRPGVTGCETVAYTG